MARDSDEYDFFVSYARADDRDGWITGFVQELLAVHRGFTGGRSLKPFFDTKEIHGLDDWRHRLYHGLSRSRLFLAFVSPRYFASEWCRREWRTWIDVEIAKHVLSAGAAPLYIVEVPGLLGSVSEQEVARQVAELCELPAPHDAFVSDASTVVHQVRRRQLNKVQPFFNAGVAALREDDLQRALERLARDLDERAAAVQRAALSETTVPPYNRNFSGRVGELLELRERLQDDRAGVISGVHGLGGVGKTELAFTYAHAFAGAYPGGRFLVPCEGKSSLQEATVVLGYLFRDRIRDEERMQPETHFKAILRCFRERLGEKEHILLVLDNITDPVLLSPEETDRLTTLGPMLHLLATTRLPAGASRHVAWMTLGELSPEAALELLDKHRPIENEREAAKRIVKQLGGFALAIELVGAYLAAHPSATYDGLAKRWGLDDLDAMATDGDVELRRHNHERRLEAVLGPTLESLSEPERLAVEYAACLAPDAVPLPWLKELVVADHPDLAAAGRRGDPWEELCQRLIRLALFSRADGEGHRPRVVRIHRLVQEVVRRRLADRFSKVRSTVDNLVRRRVRSLLDAANRQQGRWEVDALDALARHRDENGRSDPWLMNQTGVLWYDSAEWARSELMLRRSLVVFERSEGADHPDVATSLSNLAALLQKTNRLAEAEALQCRALALRDQSLGPDHPDVALSLNNLAFLLMGTNRLAEAESLYRRALGIWEQSLGADHRNVATALDNLAWLLQETNRLAEAEPLHRRALAILERSLGPNHPLVATSLDYLAQLFQDTNRLAEAESLHRRALGIWEQSLGSDHPNVATALNNLALLLEDTNRLADAELLHRRALAIGEQCFGPEHPDVAMSLNNLGLLLGRTDLPAEAEPLIRRALAIRERAFGSEHPAVATSLASLAWLFRRADRSAEAEPLHRRALAIRERSLGPSHPDVANSLVDLGEVLRLMGRLDEAEPLLRRAYEIDLSARGADHPDTAVTGYKLAMLEHALGNAAESRASLERALAVLRASYESDDHPRIVEAIRRMKEIGMSPPEL